LGLGKGKGKRLGKGKGNILGNGKRLGKVKLSEGECSDRELVMNVWK
jgi:hypothetical protein